MSEHAIIKRTTDEKTKVENVVLQAKLVASCRHLAAGPSQGIVPTARRAIRRRL